MKNIGMMMLRFCLLCAVFDRKKPQDDIESDTSSDFKNFLVQLLKKDPQNKEMTEMEYSSDADYLYKVKVKSFLGRRVHSVFIFSQTVIFLWNCLLGHPRLGFPST